MANTTKVDILRKLIREEVVKAIRQEMPSIIKEIALVSPQKPIIKETVKAKPTIPGTLNTRPMRPQPPKFNSNDPIANLLNETALNMVDSDDMSFTTENLGPDSIGVDPTSFFQPREAAVGDVNGMLATARASSDPSMVQINEVPDFSALMSSMLAKGQI